MARSCAIRTNSLIGDCRDPVVVRSHYVRYLTESYKEIATSFEQIESQQDIESSLSAIEIRCNQVCALLDACEDLPSMTEQQQREFQVVYQTDLGPKLDDSPERLLRSVEDAVIRIPDTKPWESVVAKFSRAAADIQNSALLTTP